MEDFTDNDAHNYDNYDNYDDDIVMGVNSVTSLTTYYKNINGATSETVNEASLAIAIAITITNCNKSILSLSSCK